MSDVLLNKLTGSRRNRETSPVVIQVRHRSGRIVVSDGIPWPMLRGKPPDYAKGFHSWIAHLVPSSPWPSHSRGGSCWHPCLDSRTPLHLCPRLHRPSPKPCGSSADLQGVRREPRLNHREPGIADEDLGPGPGWVKLGPRSHRPGRQCDRSERETGKIPDRRVFGVYSTRLTKGDPPGRAAPSGLVHRHDWRRAPAAPAGLLRGVNLCNWFLRS